MMMPAHLGICDLHCCRVVPRAAGGHSPFKLCCISFDEHLLKVAVSAAQAMEQQTISIAKAGITTMLKSRTSVLAAANPPSGRWVKSNASPQPSRSHYFRALSRWIVNRPEPVCLSVLAVTQCWLPGGVQCLQAAEQSSHI